MWRGWINHNHYQKVTCTFSFGKWSRIETDRGQPIQVVRCFEKSCTKRHLWAYSKSKSKVGDPSRGRSEGSLFNSYYTEVLGRTLLHSLDCSTLTLDPYLIMLSVKQDGIKYHFLSLWYDSIMDWTPVFRTMGEHSTHEANRLSWWKRAISGVPLEFHFLHAVRLIAKCIMAVEPVLKITISRHSSSVKIDWLILICQPISSYFMPRGQRIAFLCSNPGRADSVSLSTNTLGKGMNPILPPAMGK